ncbi:S8 family peptidase [Adhaeretor mobilis]|uniref:Peptidase S8/S53 domain-containing protein n=1 Tax=Adhaeretor mobilis TaxID=1930276 RepID=A0A517MQL2_9BACT|nr:S8 family peptidase [Adhaeretor mobilis]QDS97162.1 hypothetical protein HG15A2_04220 [Adhaeretor mobilis]
MDPLRHLFPKSTKSTESYQYPHKVGGGEFSAPPRDRIPHAASLVSQLLTAFDEESVPVGQDACQGAVLTFQSAPEFKLKLESLDFRPSGIELLNARVDENGVMHAAVYVPTGKASYFIKRLEQYAKEDTEGANPKPLNQALVDSITAIKRATLGSLWSDAGLFPDGDKVKRWWEIWLRDTAVPKAYSIAFQDDVYDVVKDFRQRSTAAGVQVPDRQLHFPERRVVLGHASIEQLLAIEGVFDFLAELRLAKLLPGEILALTSDAQAEFVDELRSRVVPPSIQATAVCHLDTGVNRSHPLLEMAISEEHVQTIDPNWSSADSHGHGTAMAGLALYGCLTEVLNSSDPVVLSHRLESVKIFRPDLPTEPELWGEMTIQAAARIEIAAPNCLQRVFCLTVTVEGRDNGAPSSWSAAVDQMCFGADDASPPQLMIVSAGNLPLELRHEYPKRNYLEGVEDPAHSWNALAVGAISKHASIGQTQYAGWEAVATVGDQLNPASRTSCIWTSKSWPLKPDIVMNGGNVALNPATKRADYIDDLSLLTTRVSPTGGLLTTTGDTSAAAALASRFAARLWAEYPALRPETIRALMVHSARWSEPMLEQMDGCSKEMLLRCFGYGEPNFAKACWSALNTTTLVVEESMQPFEKTAAKVKTKDMHLHKLPWPVDVLRDLLDVEVRMQVTLSYYIEPSPGRRGWTKKHRYQSHGLRFDVKRPTDTDEEFRKRISAAARDEEEQVTSSTDDRNWKLGKNLRCKGSLHSDVWSGTAADLATSGVIAVFPVTGWWKNRPHLRRHDMKTHYSLVVTIETDAEEVDLYTPIFNQIDIELTG